MDKLDEICGGDEELKAEVLRLLEEMDAVEREGFLDKSACTAVRERTGSDDGRVPEYLGNWRILREIGRGGTSGVFLAEPSDGVLNIKAAVKVLPVGLYGDEIVERFVRERKILGRLHHPYIVRLIDGGETDDHRPFLVMEWVDGVILTDHCERYSLNTGAKLDLFSKILEAVNYLHSQGVLHRDLKPANILVQADHTPRIVDFGIAKLTDRESAAARRHLTTAYRSPGLTYAYASPEQAGGETSLTAASDVYSLGVILCELLTGHLPIRLEGLLPFDAAERIRREPPDLTGVPSNLTSVVCRCLEKDPRKRYEPVQELEHALRVARAKPHEPTRRRIFWVASGAGVVTAGGIHALRQARTKPGRPTAEAYGKGIEPSISPSGEEIAFAISDRELGTRNLPSGASRTLVAGEHETFGAKWSPDGRTIAYFEQLGPNKHTLTFIRPDGSDKRVIRELGGAWADWMPDGKSLAVIHGDPLSVHELRLSDRTMKRISFPKPGSWGDVQVAVAPNGEHLAVSRYSSRGKGEVFAISRNGESVHKLTSVDTWINGLAFTPDSRSVIFSAAYRGMSQLWRAEIAYGGPAMIVPVEGTSDAMAPAFCRKTDDLFFGRRQYYASVTVGSLRQQPWLGREVAYPAGAESPAISPDGKRVAAAVSGGTFDGIWIAPFERPERVWRAVSGAFSTARGLSWSPSGNHLAFAAKADGRTSVFIAEVDGKGRHWRLTTDTDMEDRPEWSADGQSVYFLSDRAGTRSLLQAPAFHRSGKPILIAENATRGAESADGKTLFVSFGEQSATIFQRPIEGGTLVPVAGMPQVEPALWGIVSSGGLYFAVKDRNVTELRRLLGGKTERVAHVNTPSTYVALSCDSRLERAALGEVRLVSTMWRLPAGEVYRRSS